MKKPFQILIVVTSTIGFAIVSALSIVVATMFILAAPFNQGSGAETKETTVSPDNNVTAITRYISADSLSSDTVTIHVKSNSSGEEKYVGSFLGVDHLIVEWTKKNTLSIEYRSAKWAKFKNRFIDLNKETITVDVTIDAPGVE